MQLPMQQLPIRSKPCIDFVPAHVVYTPAEVKSAKAVLHRILEEVQKPTPTVQSITPIIKEVSE